MTFRQNMVELNSNPNPETNMKKRFVVAYVDFFDSHLTQEIVEAETEQDARWLHTNTCSTSGWGEHLDDFRKKTDSMSAGDFQAWCFNSDMLVSVMEI